MFFFELFEEPELEELLEPEELPELEELLEPEELPELEELLELLESSSSQSKSLQS